MQKSSLDADDAPRHVKESQAGTGENVLTLYRRRIKPGIAVQDPAIHGAELKGTFLELAE